MAIDGHKMIKNKTTWQYGADFQLYFNGIVEYTIKYDEILYRNTGV